MRPDIGDVLESVVSEIFETMYFLFFESGREVEPHGVGLVPSGEFVSIIYFTGKFEGELIMAFSNGLAKTITSNLLGLEDGEVGDPQITDTIKETANVTLGNILPKVDKREIFTLSMPQIVHQNQFIPFSIGSKRERAMQFEADGETLKLLFRWGEG
jgi:CheY-specific phosphatase CheX